MRVELWWEAEDAEHIRSRSTRYPDTIDIEPEWTLQAASDPTRVVRDPDPRSRAAYTRLIGYSPSAGFVLTVIIDPQRLLWRDRLKTRGADPRHYLERKDMADD